MIEPEFRHVWIPGEPDVRQSLLLLHGTGGTERDLIPLAREIEPRAPILSPLGKVRENGAPRFFRRFGEGVLDVEDWKFRTNELADFLASADREYGIDPGQRVVVGYSNGANIALGLLLLRPEAVAAAILFRPMFVSDDLDVASGGPTRVLILSGVHDPLQREGDPERIAAQLSRGNAQVEVEAAVAGHGLVAADLEIATAWFRRLRL